MGDKTFPCKTCGQPFVRPAVRGRPPVNCPKCRDEATTTSPIDTTHRQLIKERVAALGLKKAELPTSALVQSPVQEPTPSKLLQNERPGQFQVHVSNMGVVYNGNEEKEANSTFKLYVTKSCQGFGQVGYEVVNLFKQDGNQYVLAKEFNPVQELGLKQRS